MTTIIYTCGCQEYAAAKFAAWKSKSYSEVEAEGNLRHPADWPEGWEYGSCSKCGGTIKQKGAA